MYPPGGYILQVGKNIDYGVDRLQYIILNYWIDDLTRAVFIELPFYNVNENLFSLLTLIIEQSVTGKLIPGYTVSLQNNVYLKI